MGSLSDFYGYVRKNANSWNSPLSVLSTLYDYAYENSHGSQKYYLSQAPVLGWARRIKDSAQAAEDQYQNTGVDTPYSQRYNSINSNSLGGIADGVVKPVRMARSLGYLYGCDVKEDFNMKYKTAKIYRETSENWLNYAKYKRW